MEELTAFDIQHFMDFIDNITFSEMFNMFFIPITILIAFILLGIWINRLITNKVNKHFDTDELTLQYVMIRSLQGLPGTWCTITGIYWSINALDIAPPVTSLLSYFIFIFLVLTICRVVSNGLSGFFDLYAQKNTNMPKTTLFNTIAMVVIYAIGIVIILDHMGISVAPILTAMGVGGMAVALALQDTLANVFSGMQLIITKQIKIGDFIKLNNSEAGQVSDISWRYTTLHTPLGNAVIVPNKTIAGATVLNYNVPITDITIVIPIGVGYESDLDQVESVTLEVANNITNECDPDMDIKPTLFFTEFADSSINFEVRLHCSDFTIRGRMKHLFIKAITARYRKEGINIPFPIRTVQITKEN